jgi:hypothetical protein
MVNYSNIPSKTRWIKAYPIHINFALLRTGKIAANAVEVYRRFEWVSRNRIVWQYSTEYCFDQICCILPTLLWYTVCAIFWSKIHDDLTPRSEPRFCLGWVEHSPTRY